MPAATSPPAQGRGGAPPWLCDLLEVLDERRGLARLVAVAAAAAGLVLAAVAPHMLPAGAAVGASVGLASVLLGVAVTVAVDAADATVRGPRHVRASGAVVVGVASEPDDADHLAARAAVLAEVRGRLRLAVTTAGRDGEEDATVSAASLGTALARRGRDVVVVDLARERPDEPGVAEVVRGESRLTEVVVRDDGVARVGTGQGQAEALGGFGAVAERLPDDVDIVVALPALGQVGALFAAAAADLTWLRVVAGRTSRVELIAALDALDVAGAPAEVVLLRPSGGAGDDVGEGSLLEAFGEAARAEPAGDRPADPRGDDPSAPAAVDDPRPADPRSGLCDTVDLGIPAAPQPVAIPASADGDPAVDLATAAALAVLRQERPDA